MFKEILNDIEKFENARDLGVFVDSKKVVTFFGSARFSDDNIYSKKAEILASKLAKMGFGIITGGGESVMKGANKGATLQNMPSFGFNIVLPHEQKNNEFVQTGVVFETFSVRKLALMQSDFFVIFPGGFGTMDEFFEILTLKQVGFKKCKIYLYDSHFWAPLIEFFKVSLLKNGAIYEKAFELFEICDETDEIFAKIKEAV